MTTAVLERPVSKSDAKKAKEGKAARAALDAMQAAAAKTTMKLETKANTAKLKAAAPVNAKAAPKAKAVALGSKDFHEALESKTNAASWDKVTTKAKAAPKAKEPKPRRVSAMWVIRTNMAESLVTTGKPATVEMISKACTEAGVPKSDATIGTIVSDFMQCLAAMKSVGLVKA